MKAKTIDELLTELKEIQKKMDEAERIEEWLKAYREYLGIFIQIHEVQKNG